MAEKLHGLINLSKIDKKLIVKLKDGSSAIWCDVLEKRSPDQYGNTHTLTIYDKENRQTIYLGDFKPQQFGQAAPAPANDDNDLPF